MSEPALKLQTDDETPVPAGHRRVTNREIQDIRNALTALAQRRLEDLQNQKRVVTLLRKYFDKPWKIYQDLRNKIIEDHPAPDGWESETLPIGVSELRLHAINKLDADTQDVPEIPAHLLITDKDMPRLIKGEPGDQNQFGVGDIIHKLHFVYAGWPEDEQVKPGQDGTKVEA